MPQHNTFIDNKCLQNTMKYYILCILLIVMACRPTVQPSKQTPLCTSTELVLGDLCRIDLSACKGVRWTFEGLPWENETSINGIVLDGRRDTDNESLKELVCYNSSYSFAWPIQKGVAYVCGTVDSCSYGKGELPCNDEWLGAYNCFRTKFASCTPSTHSLSTGTIEGGTIRYNVTITGKTAQGCEGTVVYDTRGDRYSDQIVTTFHGCFAQNGDIFPDLYVNLNNCTAGGTYVSLLFPR